MAAGAVSPTVAVSLTVVPLPMPSLGVTSTVMVFPASPLPGRLRLKVSLRAVAEVKVRFTWLPTFHTKVRLTGLL